MRRRKMRAGLGGVWGQAGDKRERVDCRAVVCWFSCRGLEERLGGDTGFTHSVHLSIVFSREE